MILQGKEEIDKVVIVFTDRLLYEKDLHLYEQMQVYYKNRYVIELVYTRAALLAAITNTTMVLHDEFDYWLLDLGHAICQNNLNAARSSHVKTLDLPAPKWTLGFSATSYQDRGNTEAVSLQAKGVKIFDS